MFVYIYGGALSEGSGAVPVYDGEGLAKKGLVEGSRQALVIDACTGQEGLRAIVRQLIGDRPVTLALTHGHFDHSGGTKYFPEVHVQWADEDKRIVTEKVLDGSIETRPYEMGNRSGRQATYGSARPVFNPDRLRWRPPPRRVLSVDKDPPCGTCEDG